MDKIRAIIVDDEKPARRRLRELLEKQPTGRILKTASKWKQELLALEIVSRGRFEKSEPTIHRGADLDVPTYVRRGTPLN